MVKGVPVRLAALRFIYRPVFQWAYTRTLYTDLPTGNHRKPLEARSPFVRKVHLKRSPQVQFMILFGEELSIQSCQQLGPSS